MKSRILKRSQQQEREGMKAHGGKAHVGSGNRWGQKGDGSTDRSVVEFKRTDKKQLILKAADLEKIYHEAWADGKIPILDFHLGGRDWCIIDRNDYLEYLT